MVTSDDPAIQQFLLLCKSTKGKGLPIVINQALSHSSLFYFGELLELPEIIELKNDIELNVYYKLLQLFAYGTYPDYIASKDSLPELTPPQIKKLRQLTIVSLGSKTKILPYSLLLSSLGLQNVRELEDLIIDSIYAGLLFAKLDQKYSQLQLDYVVGRDVQDETFGNILQTLNSWSTQCDSLLKTLDDKMNYIAKKNEELKEHQKLFEAKQEAVKMTIKANEQAAFASGGSAGGASSGLHFAPDLDDPRSRKRSGKSRKNYHNGAGNLFM